jgi:hypothetical protein
MVSGSTPNGDAGSSRVAGSNNRENLARDALTAFASSRVSDLG